MRADENRVQTSTPRLARASIAVRTDRLARLRDREASLETVCALAPQLLARIRRRIELEEENP